MNLKKNQVLEQMEIIDYTHEGMGVAKHDGIAIFVKYGVKGETYDLKIIKVEKSYCYAMIMNNQDAEYLCEHYKKCGGCHIMHLDYNEQLNMKKGVVENLMRKFKVETTVHDVVANPVPTGYRNKVLMPFAKDSEGQIYCGFYRERSHQVEKINYCHLQSERSNAIAKKVMELMNEVGETVYNEDRHKGNLRHLFIRDLANVDEVMVCFVVNSRQIKQQKYVVKELTKAFPEIKSVVVNENTRRTNAVLGYRNFNLYNCNFVHEKLHDIKYKILPNAFFQINTKQTEQMYDQVIKYAELTGTESVLDAYCGAGSISLFLAKEAGHVTGIEIVPEAIKSAKQNQIMNNIDNANFICNDIEKEIKKYENKDDFFDVVVVDPPRKGLEDNLINILKHYKPKRVVYVSCNPATLARDLEKLSDTYNVDEVMPFDIFSHTFHVENVVKLTIK